MTDAAATHPPDRIAPCRPSGWLLAAAFGSLYFLWGSTYLGIKGAVLGGVGDARGTGFPPFFLAGARSAIAGAILYAYLRLWASERRPTLGQWAATAVIGVLLLLGGNGLV